MSRRRAPKVSIKWEKREDEEGRRYAILRWTGPNPETGKVERQNQRIGYQTPEEAEDLRHRHECALVLEVASPIDGSGATVGSVLTWYIADLDKRPVSELYGDCELTRCETLRRHLGTVGANEVTANTLSRYLGDRRREPSRFGRAPKRSSLLMEIDTLRRAYRSAIEQRRIPGPIPAFPSGKLPNDKRPHRRLTEAEVSKLIAAGHLAGDGLGWLVQVLAWSGRRPVAVLELEVGDLERMMDKRVSRAEQLVMWRRDKGGEALGWGPTTEPSRQALAARAGEVGSGKLWGWADCIALHRPFKRAVAQAGLVNVQPYDLRRFAVTRILDGVGQNLKEAMKFTGHTMEATLHRYAFAAEGSAEAKAGKIGWSPLREAEQAEEG